MNRFSESCLIHCIMYEDPLEQSRKMLGKIYLFILHQRLEKRIWEQLQEASMLICMLPFLENYNLVSRLLKSLHPYGSILSEYNLGLLSCHLLL